MDENTLIVTVIVTVDCDNQPRTQKMVSFQAILSECHKSNGEEGNLPSRFFALRQSPPDDTETLEIVGYAAFGGHTAAPQRVAFYRVLCTKCAPLVHRRKCGEGDPKLETPWPISGIFSSL